MNTTIDQIFEPMQFPSHVTAPCDNETVKSLSGDILSAAMDRNNIFASGNVHWFARDHYIDTATGTYGIESLIKSILRQNGSIFPKDVANTELRQIAIAGSMFTDEIIACVRGMFGADRYPNATILMYLSQFADAIGKIQLTGKEDCNRPCNRPRCKWYLID